MRPNVPLAPYTTLRAGGEAEWFAECADVEALAATVSDAQRTGLHVSILGWGSNLLPSDRGVPGLVVHNLARQILFEDETVTVDTGCGYQELFLACAQRSLAGLEFAVGIPGTVGGALVSNAGAYRSDIAEFLVAVEIVRDGERSWAPPGVLELSYRDSVLRRHDPPQMAVLRARLRLRKGDPKAIYDEAREYQRQRIGKQPPPASAGSFFKNVISHALAQTLETLPPGPKGKGVVPAGYLIEACGLKGFRHGGAMVASRHANFLLNVGGASADEIRQLAEHVKSAVRGRFDVELEEEVLYFGDWSHWPIN